MFRTRSLLTLTLLVLACPGDEPVPADPPAPEPTPVPEPTIPAPVLPAPSAPHVDDAGGVPQTTPQEPSESGGEGSLDVLPAQQAGDADQQPRLTL
jgi:hypothetical protein